MKLTGRTILITGGSAGIGLAFALKFLELGNEVVVTGRRQSVLDQVKAKKPTLDFDPRYGTDTGFWTTSMFIETIYKEMVALNPPAAPASRGRGAAKNQKGSGE